MYINKKSLVIYLFDVSPSFSRETLIIYGKWLLEKWLQLFTPSYICILCNKTLQHLPLRDVSVLWMKLSCDLLWLITWGGSDGIPVPNPGFKWLCVFPLSFCHHCVHKLVVWWEAHHMDAQLTACKLPACKWGHPRPRLPPTWLMSKPSRDETGLGHFSRTF